MLRFKKLMLTVLAFTLVFITGCSRELLDEKGYYIETGLDYVELSRTEQEGREVKNLILIIGDGMGFNHIESAAIALLSDDEQFDLHKMPYQSEVITLNYHGEITDSAAGGTAFSTGFKTTNGSIGRDPYGNDLMNIMEFAKEKGYATGIVTTESLSDATGAAFSAHIGSRYSDAIPLQQVNSGVDIMIGGGRVDFEHHKDTIQEKGYEYINNMDDFRSSKADRFFAILTTTHFMNNANTPSLAELVHKTIQILSRNETGFILMIEEGLIDNYSHARNMDATITKVQELDKALRVALNFARSNHDTLVVVTADHETGGIQLGTGQPSNAWFTSGDHTAVNVPLYAFGLHAYLFDDKVLHNTDANKLMMQAMGFLDFPSLLTE